jgi:hypothetical protein
MLAECRQRDLTTALEARLEPRARAEQDAPVATPRLAAAIAVLLTLGWLLFAPPLLTDGDSCLYAAMGHDLATGGGWAAPQWAHGGAAADFHENPPLAVWTIGALEGLGLDTARAPVVANALWLLLLAAAAWRLGGGGRGAGAVVLGVLLLHYPVAKYAVRASLELPFTACAVAAVAWMRGRRESSLVWAGLFFGGAILARGPFALLVPALWLVDARIGLRRPIRRALAAGVLGLSLAVLFDLFHRRATGHGFWAAFWSEQLGPSLAGTAPHANRQPTWQYYGGRLLLYGAPWLPFALLAGLSRWKRLRPDFLLGLVWVGLVLAGAVVAQRQASRYLFAAWPGVALMVGAVATNAWLRREAVERRRWAAAVMMLLPALTVGKGLLTPDDDWAVAARQLRERASYGWGTEGPPTVYGPFSAHDDRAKQFLRHHLGVWAFREPDEGAPPGSLRFSWRGPGEAPAGSALVTPGFRLDLVGEDSAPR